MTISYEGENDMNVTVNFEKPDISRNAFHEGGCRIRPSRP
jgi:hypothetical protein